MDPEMNTKNDSAPNESQNLQDFNYNYSGEELQETQNFTLEMTDSEHESHAAIDENRRNSLKSPIEQNRISKNLHYSPNNGLSEAVEENGSIISAMSPIFMTRRSRKNKIQARKILDDDDDDSENNYLSFEAEETDKTNAKKSSSNTDSFVSFSQHEENSIDNENIFNEQTFSQELIASISDTNFVQKENEAALPTTSTPLVNKDSRNYKSIQELFNEFEDSSNESITAPGSIMKEKECESNPTLFDTVSQDASLEDQNKMQEAEEHNLEQTQISAINASFETVCTENDFIVYYNVSSQEICNETEYASINYNCTQDLNSESVINTNSGPLENVTIHNDLIIIDKLKQEYEINYQTDTSGIEKGVSSSENSEIEFSSFRRCRKRLISISSSNESLDSEQRNPTRKKRSKNVSEVESDDEDFEKNLSDINNQSETSTKDSSIDDFVCSRKRVLRKRKPIDYSNLDNSKSQSVQKRLSSNKAIKKLKECLKRLNIPLKQYKDFWQDCKKNVDSIIKIVNFLERTAGSSELLNTKSSEVMKKLEIYQDSLELDKSVVISYNERITRSKFTEKERLLQKQALNEFKHIRCIKTVQNKFNNKLNALHKYTRKIKKYCRK